jgi:phosphonate transport system substrate-binding protein
MAGVKTAIAERYRHLNLRVIATSTPFPGFALVANRETLAPEVLQAVRRALLALDPAADPAMERRMASWGEAIRNGAVAAGQCDYRDITAILERLPWPLPGTEP